MNDSEKLNWISAKSVRNACFTYPSTIAQTVRFPTWNESSESHRKLRSLFKSFQLRVSTLLTSSVMPLRKTQKMNWHPRSVCSNHGVAISPGTTKNSWSMTTGLTPPTWAKWPLAAKVVWSKLGVLPLIQQKTN